MRVLIDTNILLDFLLQREPFRQAAEELFQAIEADSVVGYVTASTLTDIFYIAWRQTGSLEIARQAVAETLTVMLICPVDRSILESALASDTTDFEDAVQIACAVSQELEASLTRDTRGFTGSSVPVLSIP